MRLSCQRTYSDMQLDLLHWSSNDLELRSNFQLFFSLTWLGFWNGAGEIVETAVPGPRASKMSIPVFTHSGRRDPMCLENEPFRKIVSHIRCFFRFWRRSLGLPFQWKFAPLEVRSLFCSIFSPLNWTLSEKRFFIRLFPNKKTLIFSFWRGHIGPLEGLVPPPFLKPLVKSCSGRVLILPEEAKSDTVRLGTS